MTRRTLRLVLICLLVLAVIRACTVILPAIQESEEKRIQPTATPAAQQTVLVPLLLSESRWSRGIGAAGYGVPPIDVCADIRLTGAQWYYDWWYYGWNCDPVIPFVPMVWDEETVISATQALTGTGWLLGFNEPNLPSQANMTPALAFQLWPQLEATGRKLVSPAVFASTNCPGCGTWLEEWWSLCQARTPEPCRVDAIALHWYGCDTVMLEQYLQRRTLQFPGLPLWLTEWGCNTGTEAEQASYTAAALPIIQRYTERNAIFSLYPYENNRGLVIGGQLNLIGLAYSGQGPQPYPGPR